MAQMLIEVMLIGSSSFGNGRRGTVTLLIGNLDATDLTMSKSAYRCHRFPPAIIQLIVWI